MQAIQGLIPARIATVFLIAPQAKCPRHFSSSASRRDEMNDCGKRL